MARSRDLYGADRQTKKKHTREPSRPRASSDYSPPVVELAVNPRALYGPNPMLTVAIGEVRGGMQQIDRRGNWGAVEGERWYIEESEGVRGSSWRRRMRWEEEDDDDERWMHDDQAELDDGKQLDRCWNSIGPQPNRAQRPPRGKDMGLRSWDDAWGPWIIWSLAAAQLETNDLSEG
nr:unnamed protein product [Digitaria exilis]